MFKNTNNFFKKVFKDSVSQIDQDNYVNTITDNHNIEKLKTLYSDLEFFIFFKNDILESEIDSLQIKNKIKEYQKEGKEVPYTTRKNIEYEIVKRKKLSLEGIPETKQFLDLEKMFYQLDMCPIRRLKYNIGLLIREIKNQVLENDLKIKDHGVENKISEKWYALQYWFELIAHGKRPPIDLEGAFIKNELVKVGAQKCNSKGQSFYSAFREIDINDPVMLKKEFGVNWKDKILKLSKNDHITIKYINEKYK